MSRRRRLRLFVRDYFAEFGIPWSLARMNDCERAGGHFWRAKPDFMLGGWCRTCSKCGTSESLAQTSGTGSTISFSLNASNAA